MESPPYYIVFAGVNGAGKSTLYRTGLWQNGPINNALARVNADEIAVEHGWDWRDGATQMKAGRLAVKRIHELFAAHESFNQETTLTGRSVMRNIRTAREAGYHIVLFYIGLDDPSIANERVVQRQQIGGHFVSSETIARRYETSLANLAKAIPVCDETYLYDNSVQLELEARFVYDRLAFFNLLDHKFEWVYRTLESLGYHEVEL